MENFPKFVIALLGIALGSFSTIHADAFIPNDPFFDPGTDSGAESGYYGQWHLKNQMPLVDDVNTGLDANLWGAWQRGLTGAGVIIGIVDDGVQGDHPDLSANFRNEYSWGFSYTIAENLAQTNRGAPVLASDNHGTAVAGVAAAVGGNAIGVTGAAPHAGFAALRLLKDETEAYAEGKFAYEVNIAAILYQGGEDPFAPVDWNAFSGRPPVRVKNHSYGGPAFAFQYNHSTFQESAEHKVIHVFSAGNSREDNLSMIANSGREKDKSSPHVLSVAAFGSKGKYSDYSSYGANVFVSAPSSGGSVVHEIATTDRTTPEAGYNNPDGYETNLATADGGSGNYTSTFGGTSSAAPLIAGIMALGVQANSNLDIHLAKHALVATSRNDLTVTTMVSDHGGWKTNAAGNRFSADYGFGLIDADAFTQKVTEIEMVPGSVQKLSSDQQAVAGENTFSESRKTLTRSYNANFSETWNLECVGVTLEFSGFQTAETDNTTAHLLEYEGAILGDLRGWLTSAQGTTYELFFDDRFMNGDEYDYGNRYYLFDTLSWTFTSNAYWGEEVNGTWTLEIENASENTEASDYWGQWDSFSLDFYTGEVRTVPEPSSILLFLFAGTGLWLLRAKKKTHPSR